MYEIVTGEWWTDEYMVRPIGVLECPMVSMITVVAAEQQEEKPKVKGEWVVISS